MTKGTEPLRLSLASRLNAATIGPKRTPFTLIATDEECRDAAEAAGVDGISNLKAEGHVLRRKDIVRISARIEADIRQTCVVTLEPLAATLTVEMQRQYGTPPDTGPEVEIDPLSEDPPDPLDNGEVPLMDAVVEQLVLEIDPYPRKPGLEDFALATDADAAEEPSERPSPFSVLAGLKDRLN